MPTVRSVPGAARPRVVVVGAGHAGLEAVRALRRAEVDVVLVDRHNYHTFQPLLYQVATAGLQAGHITQPVRHIFQDQPNADFRLARVEGVDFAARRLVVSDGPPIAYDHLVLAAGASTAFYGIEGADRYAFPLKSVADATRLRSHVIACFEAADQDPARLDEGALTFVIVGGGPTGVEMAGALVELFEGVFRKDYHHLEVDRAQVVLVEMGERLLTGYAPHLQDYARRELERRGVEVRLGTAVHRVTPSTVHLSTGEVLRTRTLVWAAGVRANPLADVLGVEQGPAGRIVVTPTLQLPGHPEVYVAGDLAAAADPSGRLYPQVAQVAIQQGRHAARNILRTLAGRPPLPFRYRDLGTMATIGRNAAVAQLPSGLTLRGRLAWLAWVVVHVANLMGFRNRASVTLSWVYNYFTWDRGPRLVLASEPEDEVGPVLAPQYDPAARAEPAETAAP